MIQILDSVFPGSAATLVPATTSTTPPVTLTGTSGCIGIHERNFDTCVLG